MIEVSLDCLEFLISTLPEVLIQRIPDICATLLSLTLRDKDEISGKAMELMDFAKEVLTADLLIPHFLTIIDDQQ